LFANPSSAVAVSTSLSMEPSMQELVESSKELVELSNDVSLVKVIHTTSDEPLLPNSVGVGNHEYSSILQKEVLP